MNLKFEHFGLNLLLMQGTHEQGRRNRGGSGGVGPPLEFEIYLVNFLKNREKKGFFSIRPPLGKNRSSAPAHELYFHSVK